MPFRNIIDATYKPEKKEISKDYFHLAYFLKEAAEGKRNLDNYYLANKDYKPHYLFYMHILQDQGKKITYKDYTELDSTDRIIAHQGEVNLFISENYKYQRLDSNRNITIYEIYGK